MALLALDSQQGLLQAAHLEPFRIWFYAFLIGAFPCIQIFRAPFLGKKIDGSIKKSSLQAIHIANLSGYACFGLAVWEQNLWLAMLAPLISALTGSIVPLAKTLLIEATPLESRTQVLAKAALIKGGSTFIGPLIGICLTMALPQLYYIGPFLFAALLSFSALILTSWGGFQTSVAKKTTAIPMKSTLNFIFRQHFAHAAHYFLIFLTYCIFVKFAPVTLSRHFENDALWINYFFAVLGGALVLNQLFILYVGKLAKRLLSLAFLPLFGTVLFFTHSHIPFLSLSLLFLALLLFSFLMLNAEACLSLKSLSGAQGATQGVLFSLENLSYFSAPLIGALLTTYDHLYPMYFVLFSIIIAYILLQRTKADNSSDAPVLAKATS